MIGEATNFITKDYILISSVLGMCETVDFLGSSILVYTEIKSIRVLFIYFWTILQLSVAMLKNIKINFVEFFFRCEASRYRKFSVNNYC